MTERDSLYRDAALPGDFVFDDAVAQVFPDMINRSVPGYAAIVNMIELVAARHAQAGTRLYDLGCSLGASTVALARGAAQQDCVIIGVDNAPAMLARAEAGWRERFPAIEWRCADVRETPVESASMVAMNFTLQFLPVDDRLPLLERIHDGLVPGGALVLSEKIAGHDAHADALLTALHHDFKRRNGYSELEISRKRTALENVLIPETLQQHQVRLSNAGFRRTDLWFQCFNFVSLVAVP
jgi:tRNA (cmo5U34)-methyltransferase